ncbi:MAG: 50S ribosomal protein L24 [Halobacteriovoraceae bacterium]|jgi:large subunit ribosomal protein L24|nr:50S ribosomal protein L24 [Halobacteriovoraceae bacterium]MBT5095965.1 50S ribosomal protein L24 [Halobacteriovoraceae bacterium]
MQKIKVDDEIIVLAGKDKGKTGTVSKLFLKKKRVLIAGVNMVKKAMKPTQENPTGGIVEIEQTLHLSNIAVVSPKTSKATKVRIENKDGKNVRIAVACGSVLK